MIFSVPRQKRDFLAGNFAERDLSLGAPYGVSTQTSRAFSISE